jgi:hypothetical protein
VLFLGAAALILAGGPLHPGGTMAEMLGHVDWVLSHLLVLGGFVALLAAMLLLRRALPWPERSERWLRLAWVGTLLQTIEMVFHTAAVVDHANLVAGRSTPILTTHLVLAVICYPIFGVTFAGFIVGTARDRVLGSPWIAWLGVAGALAHGAAPPLVLLARLEGARVLFPMVMLLAAWLVLAALWPARAAAGAAARDRLTA